VVAHLREFIHPFDLRTYDEALEQASTGRALIRRARVCSHDGSYHWVEAHLAPFRDESGKVDGVSASMRNVDVEVQALAELDRQARIDTLTGLVTRREALHRIEQAAGTDREPGGRIGVLFCDIDHFKEINDQFGHAAGYAVLRSLATRISESVRLDDVVARIGGDELPVLIAGLHDLAAASEVAEKVRQVATEPISIDGRQVSTSLSIGVTLPSPASRPTPSSPAPTQRCTRPSHSAGTPWRPWPPPKRPITPSVPDPTECSIAGRVDRLAQLLSAGRPDDPRRDAALRIQHQRARQCSRRYTRNATQQGAVRVHDAGEVHTQLGGEGPGRSRLIADVQPEHPDRRLRLGQCHQVRHLIATGCAPGGPVVDHHDGSGQVRPVHLLPVQGAAGQGRHRLTIPRRQDLEPRDGRGVAPAAGKEQHGCAEHHRQRAHRCEGRTTSARCRQPTHSAMLTLERSKQSRASPPSA